MSVRTAPIYPLLAGALLLAAGCASSPPGHGAGQGQGGGAGSPAPSASPAGSAAASDAARPDAAGAGAASAGGGTGSAQTSGPDGPGQTSDERRAGLDKRLDDSLGSFDAELRTEQQRVAQERDTRRASATASAAAEGQGADKNADKSADTSGSAGTEVPAPDDKPSGTHRRGDASRRRDTSGDLKSEKASKKPDDNAGNGASAREIPDGSDDDVGARRPAASGPNPSRCPRSTPSRRIGRSRRTSCSTSWCTPSTRAYRRTSIRRRSTSNASTPISARRSRATSQHCCAARSRPRANGARYA